jgi:dethiobiotin synthetase
MEGVFITGTDTGVGKTTISAGLVQLINGTRPVFYWKPIQTGTVLGDDTRSVQELTNIPPESIVEPVYRFPEPLSPHMAAKKWGKTVDLEALMTVYQSYQKREGFMVIEGAGGILVPFNDTVLQIEFIKQLGLPLVIVAEDRLGAINQCLLTVKIAREESIEVLGVILTKARGNLGNAEAISQFGAVKILAEFDPAGDSRTIVAQVGGNSELRTLFNVGSLPT